MTTVLLVDDQALLRLGFRMILEAEDDLEVVGEAGDGAGRVAWPVLSNPTSCSWTCACPASTASRRPAQIVASRPETTVLILTTFDLDEYVYAGLRSGASGFLLKDAPPGDLIAAIRTVAAGDAVIAPTATRRLIDQFAAMLPSPGSGVRGTDALAALTEREREVFVLMADGRSNREIAQALHVSEGTVKIHVGRVFAKLNVRDRVQAVVLAYETGVVKPGSSGRRA